MICALVKEMLPFACGQKTDQHNEGGTSHEQPEHGSTIHELLTGQLLQVEHHPPLNSRRQPSVCFICLKSMETEGDAQK